MLKENNDMRSHFSTDIEYKKKSNNMNKDFKMFVSVFFASMLVILGFVKIISPNVDLGDTDSDNIEVSEDRTHNAGIDERLKDIKDEDVKKDENEDSIFSPDLDEKVVLPNLSSQAENSVTEFANSQSEKIQTPQTNVEEKQSSSSGLAPIPSINIRVVVGSYSTEQQAEDAKQMLMRTGAVSNPIVKKVSGSYTLQVGSYSTREKAQQATNELLRNNYAARIIVE